METRQEAQVLKDGPHSSEIQGICLCAKLSPPATPCMIILIIFYNIFLSPTVVILEWEFLSNQKKWQEVQSIKALTLPPGPQRLQAVDLLCLSGCHVSAH